MSGRIATPAKAKPSSAEPAPLETPSTVFAAPSSASPTTPPSPVGKGQRPVAGRALATAVAAPEPPIHSASRRCRRRTLRERTSCQPQTAIGVRSSDRCRARRAASRGRRRSRPASRARLRTARVGGVVEARILDRPGRERRRDERRQSRSGQARKAPAAPALEEGPEGLGETLVGRGTAGRAHRTRDRVGDGPATLGAGG